MNNGDFIIVKKIRGREIHNSFRYVHADVARLDKDENMDIWLFDDLLHNDLANFNSSHHKRMLIDFDIRMRNKGIKRSTKQYDQAMHRDKYLNALRVKFGYAITCHKSQGGEWDHVYLYLTKSLKIMNAEQIQRWLYTAVTRAKESLTINPGEWSEPIL